MRPANTETQASMPQIYARQILRGTRLRQEGGAGREETSYHLGDGSGAAGASGEACAAAEIEMAARQRTYVVRLGFRGYMDRALELVFLGHKGFVLWALHHTVM
jgi:hypothetical protein